MMALSSLIVGVVLLLLLLAVAVRGWLASREAPELTGRDEETGQEACPPEFVSKIFSQDDWTYVRGMKSTGLERLFRKERRSVALVWVRQTSFGIRRIMREHAAAARHSSSLEPATELKIFLQFAALLMTCGAMRVGIHVAGPLWVGGLARFAQNLVQQIAEAERAFELATREHKMDAVSSL
jgi:hypothetical protein